MGGGGNYSLICTIVPKPPTKYNKNENINIEKVFYNKVGNVYSEIDPAAIDMSWWTTKTNMNTARNGPGGCGDTINSTLAFGGMDASNSTTASSETYNGTSWTSTGRLNTKRWLLAGCGVLNSALNFGGRSGSNNYSNAEIFNGSNWSNISYLNAKKNDHSGCGVSNSALSIGGTSSSKVELYNGISWSYTTNMNNAKNAPASCGVSNNALEFGGFVPNSGLDRSTITESYNGTTWSVKANMNIGRDRLAGCGIANNALSAGGYIYNNSSSELKANNNAEIYNGMIWINISKIKVTRSNLSGSGSVNSALAFGGGTGTANLATVEQFTRSVYNPDLANWPDTSALGTLLSSNELTLQ